LTLINDDGFSLYPTLHLFLDQFDQLYSSVSYLNISKGNSLFLDNSDNRFNEDYDASGRKNVVILLNLDIIEEKIF